MSLKEYMLHDHKEQVYAFYKMIHPKAQDYDKLTRNDIYNDIISLYKEDPETILRLCSMEEIHILKKLLDENILRREHGYIDYLLFQDLEKHYLILHNENEYYIPDDFVNCVKMAMNLFDEQTVMLQDVLDSVLIGVCRIYNVLALNQVAQILKEHSISYDDQHLKDYIKRQPKLKDKMDVIRYKNVNYLVSLEFNYYQDVFKLRKDFQRATYSLEELISFGKYKLNLFQDSVLQFLNFLEIHLRPSSIDELINDLIFYAGFDINSDGILWDICDHIEDLYKEVVPIISEFPIWIYSGNSLKHLKENVVLPGKNDPCICGSGKKFKNCCEKLFK